MFNPFDIPGMILYGGIGLMAGMIAGSAMTSPQMASSSTQHKEGNGNNAGIRNSHYAPPSPYKVNLSRIQSSFLVPTDRDFARLLNKKYQM